MNMSRLKLISMAGLAALAWSGAAHAQIAGGTSDGTKVNVGPSTVMGGPHVPNRPGIGVPNTNLTTRVDFQGLQASVGSDPVTGVSTVSAVTGTITDHSQFGRFDFAKVGTANLYFGEWTQTGSATAGDHTVYYVGDDGGTTTRPSPGTATYSVKGISDYATKGILSGTFTANFIGTNSGTLTGSVTNGSHTVNIGTAVISGINFSGSGASVTPSSGPSVSGGSVSGRFYGAGAPALAGIATFAGNRQYDTAFGGTKN
ncbi:hypothetical protein E5A73_20760 [Sphingomonas gei]|uniref:Transferrin-binding protein B C-lobe/N-lobe beta barrel domain-containing protein n=1 Tax=Sphingomonas gei TaxID=1395960 RepID=A0A4S1X0I3_9SPHN|nr:Slam-dependent surface lipoprotein [Sphingomonas gei]TGX48735.1 hypothetical protein E5A73_20760 [Sphingomonas gei]